MAGLNRSPLRSARRGPSRSEAFGELSDASFRAMVGRPAALRELRPPPARPTGTGALIPCLLPSAPRTRLRQPARAMSPPFTFTGIQRLLKFEIPQPRACGAQPPALIGEDSAPSCGLPERGVDRDLRSAIRQVVSSFGRTPGALPGSNFGSSNSNDGRDEVPCQESDRTACGRRRFLGWSLAVSCGLLIPGGRAAAAATGPARQLEFYNLHTGEALRAVYWEGGRYLPDALA